MPPSARPKAFPPRPPRVALLLESSRASGRTLLQGIAQYAHLHGPWRFYWETAGLDQTQHLLRNHAVDGIIVRDVGNLDELIQSGLPMVIVGHSRTEIPGLLNVVTDSKHIGQVAARHLLDCGLRHFAYCGLFHSEDCPVPWSTERAQHFSHELGTAGYTPHLYPDPPPHAPASLANEIEHIAAWLTSLPKPVGLLASNDDRGQLVTTACRAASLRVPEDVAVLGVDNDELVCGLSNPPLSSIALNFHKAGYDSAELLHQMMLGKPARTRRILVTTSHVVTRHSTSILAVDDPIVSQAIAFIRQNNRRRLSVTEVARAVAASRRVLEKRFKTCLNRSILSEIRRQRVEQITRLLAETNHSIGEIAELAGFEGPQHFARYFRTEKGTSPNEFRKQNRRS